MKKLTMAMLAVVLLAGMASVSFAQGGGGRRGGGGGGGGGGGRGGAGVAMLLSGVADSAAVAAKALEIAAKYQEETAPIVQAAQAARGGAAGGGGRGMGGLDSATNAKIQEINAKRNAEIRALLTKEPDQKKFDENVAAQAAARGRRGGGGQ